MDYRCGDGRCSFEIEHRTDSRKVAGMHEARTGKMKDVQSRTIYKAPSRNLLRGDVIGDAFGEKLHLSCGQESVMSCFLKSSFENG